ncbi:MAG: Transcriptional regulator, DeoR family [uncultured Acidimicrobiales bacterium]|uniref:Transcriptional regulator, DeoR family n=1 Tax=uncultured Acidimicrobiales bacterium TaxID=310071 RepID=A0A6J4HHX6_9ACTN|nr:MAG: Transcriptional regulator, DeoR family [uncultured Acidimicrobiales bacterium]
MISGHFPPGFIEVSGDLLTRPTARVLALLELLQGGGQRTVGELAERLGVDERTVRRYAEHLADLGIPIEAQRGRYGGYSLAPTFKLPPLMLTDDEAVAVALGLDAARRAGLLTTENAAVDSAMAKVRRVLPPVLAGRLQALMATSQFTGATREAAAPGASVMLDLADAASTRRSVTIDYTAWDGRTGSRVIDGYGLVFHGGRWYVTGYDHTRQALRTFRLDRISRVLPAEGRYEVPGDFDPVAQVLAGIASVGWAHEVSVVLHTSPEVARRRVSVAVGRLTEVAGGVRLETRAERLDGMAQLLAGLGWPFTIETPDALRDEVAALAERLRAAASATPTPAG